MEGKQMQSELKLEDQLHDVVYKAIEKAINKHKLQTSPPKDWMSLKEGAQYAGVSINTFNNFRLKGLKVCVILGVNRVSKEEIDNFFKANSY